MNKYFSMSQLIDFELVYHVPNYCLLYLFGTTRLNVNLFFGACRCIAVKTTLSEEILKTAGPSLIRNEIGNISLDDILSGGSDGYSM